MARAGYSTITERPQDVCGNDYEDTASTGGGWGCGFFRRFFFGGGHSHDLLRDQRGGGGGSVYEEKWPEAKLKELKEFSETALGPKWKNFVRKMGKALNPKKPNNETAQQFQYSPQSYALNFADDDDEEEEDGNLLHSFSSRFATHSLINDRQQARPAAL